MDNIKRIPIKEFREKGYLQEVNRLFFHQLGLALEVVVDEETGDERLGGVWDYRDDPEGIGFGGKCISKKKAQHVAALSESKRFVRETLYGDMIESVSIPTGMLGWLKDSK